MSERQCAHLHSRFTLTQIITFLSGTDPVLLCESDVFEVLNTMGVVNGHKQRSICLRISYIAPVFETAV